MRLTLRYYPPLAWALHGYFSRSIRIGRWQIYYQRPRPAEPTTWHYYAINHHSSRFSRYHICPPEAWMAI